MRRHVLSPVVFALLTLAPGGCMPDQSKVMSACLTEVKRFYPAYVASNMDDPGIRYIIACMEAKGYDFSISAADCNSKHPLPTQPTCYAPQGVVAATIDQLWRPSKPD
jgi:hypothetical protein